MSPVFLFITCSSSWINSPSLRASLHEENREAPGGAPQGEVGVLVGSDRCDKRYWKVRLTSSIVILVGSVENSAGSGDRDWIQIFFTRPKLNGTLDSDLDRQCHSAHVLVSVLRKISAFSYSISKLKVNLWSKKTVPLANLHWSPCWPILFVFQE